MTCRWCTEPAMIGDVLCYAHGERCALIQFESEDEMSREEAEVVAERQINAWESGKPPNEETVEVEYDGGIIRARAFWGRDGYRPHWRSEDGCKHWDPAAFQRWRYPAQGHAGHK